MTNKLISFDLESTGYTDEDGNFVEPEKAEDLAKVAMVRMLPKEEMSITDMVESLMVKVDIILQLLQKEKGK